VGAIVGLELGATAAVAHFEFEGAAAVIGGLDLEQRFVTAVVAHSSCELLSAEEPL
jgi:hypothetical protein